MKQIYIYKYCAVATCLVLFGCINKPDPELDRHLFLPVEPNPSSNAQQSLKRLSVKVLNSKLVRINPILLNEAQKPKDEWRPFIVNLGFVESYEATTSRFGKVTDEVVIWGAGGKGGVRIAIEETVSGGLIDANNRQFSLHPTRESGIYQLLEIDKDTEVENTNDYIIVPRMSDWKPLDKISADLCDKWPIGTPPVGKGARPSIMILWTPAARIWLESENPIRPINTEIAFIVDNLMYATSSSPNFKVYPTIVHTQEIQHVEIDPGSTLADLYALREGRVRDVHSLRDSFRADLVTLIGHYPTAQECGIGYITEEPSPATESYGYNVVNVDVQGSGFCNISLTGVHELGHNFGMHHDRANAGDASLGFNYGYISEKGEVRSIMAYSNECSRLNFQCPRIPVFSNPYYELGKFVDAMGVAADKPNAAHNMEVLCRNAGIIEKYR
ncbi:MAG: reprolysin-like metallopeptidase [Candidatus Thiodiazotropha sp.]